MSICNIFGTFKDASVVAFTSGSTVSTMITNSTRPDVYCMGGEEYYRS